MTSQGYVYGNNNYRFGDGESSRENSTGNFYFCGSSRTAASTTRRPGILKTNSAGAGIVSKVFTNGQNSQICYGNYNNAQNKLAIGMLMAAANSSIALMDSNLNFIGANALTLTNTNLNVQSVYLDDDGSIYVLSTNAALFPNLQFLTKFDSSFNEIWQRTFDNQGGAQIDYVDSEAIYIYKPQIMQTAAGNISYPWLWKLPKDGGKTGTYTIGGVSVTYAVSTSATFTVGANPITIENGAVVTTLASNAATSNSNGYNATASAGTNVFRPTI
jgi:hypothetical protein